MSKRQDIDDADNWFKTENKDIIWDVVDADEDPLAMTGWTLTFKLYAHQAASVAILTVVPTIGNGLATDDRATVATTPADTSALPAGLYVYELSRTDSGNAQVMAYGTATLKSVRNTA